MTPIFVMAEHPEKTDELKAALASPVVAGLLVRPTATDIAANQFTTLAAMIELAAAAGKKVHLGLAPLPMLAGQPCINLDGENFPLVWQQSCISDDAAVINVLANFLTTNNLMGVVDGIRNSFTACADGDCETGFHFAPKANQKPVYLVDWMDAGLTPGNYLAAMLAAANARSTAFKGKIISLSILDPLNWRLGDGAILPRPDHGAMFQALNGACYAGLSGNDCAMMVSNTNFSLKMNPSIMLNTQQMASKYGSLGLQLVDTDPNTAAADNLATIQGARQYGAQRIEIHQVQATPGLLAALATAA